MKKLFLFYCLAFVTSLICSAQTSRFYLSEDWVTESGTQNHFIEAYSTTDGSGDVYVVGATLNSTGNYDILVTKYLSGGSIDWSYQKDGIAGKDDVGTFVHVDGSGNVYVTGGIVNNASDSTDVFVAKLDNTGSEVWTYFKNGTLSDDDIGTNLFLDASSNVYITGSVTESSTNKQDVYTLKLSSGGVFQWEDIRNFSSNIEGGIDGYYDNSLNTCNIYSASNTFSPVLVNKTVFSSTGTFISSSFIDSTSQGNIVTIEAFTRDSDNNFYLTGMAEDNNGSKDIYAIKLDSLFSEDWRITIEGGDSVEDFGTTIFVDESGYVYVGGTVRTLNSGADYFTAKISNTGTLEWQNTAGGLSTGDDIVESIVVNDSGYVIVSGYSHNSNDFDYFNVCYNSIGEMVWNSRFDNGVSGDDKVINSAIKEGNLYVTGQVETATGIAYKTIKYESYYKPSEIYKKNDSTDHYMKNDVVLNFKKAALATSSDNYNNTNKTFGNLSDFLNATAITAMKNKITTDDINLGEWKAIKVMPHWRSSDTLHINRDGDTITIPPVYSSLILDIPSGFYDTTVRDSLSLLTDYISSSSLNYLHYINSSPNDRAYQASDQLYLKTARQYDNIDIEPAWNYSTGKSTIKVGIFDSGINYGHEDFTDANKNSHDRTKLVHSRVADGRCYFCGGKPKIDAGGQPDNNDVFAATHGTAVAGIIAANRDNELSIAGIAGGSGDDLTKGVTLFDLKVANSQGTFTSATLRSALFDAGLNNPQLSTTQVKVPGYNLDIINNSWESPSTSNIDFGVLEAFAFAYKSNCILVNASGNGSGNANTLTFFPGAMPDDWLIMVGASDASGVRAGFSNFSNKIDFAAPGVEQLVHSLTRNTRPYASKLVFGNKTDDFEGTSFSTPQVSGIAALMKSYLADNNSTDLAIEDVEILIEKYGSEFFAAPTIPQTGYEQQRGWGLPKASNTMKAIDINSKEVIHINSDDPGRMSSVDNPSLQQSTVVLDLVPQVSLSKNPTANASGIYEAEKYLVTCSIPFTIPSGRPVIDEWPRHSYAEGLKEATEIGNSGSPTNRMFYNSETWNELTTINWSSGTAGTAVMNSYFYKVTRRGTGAGSVLLTTPFWVPFNPSTYAPKYGFTLYTSTWPLSTQELEEESNNTSLYPNPTQNQFWIETDARLVDKDLSVNVYSIDGRKLLTKVFTPTNTNNKIQISTFGLSSGMYFVEVVGNELSETHKLIIE